MAIRLNKLLAMRGIGARRKCDALIQAGSVRVNGTVVREPGTKVEPERDRILVHGRPIPGRSALRYVMLHKPVGLITTLDDPEGRPTIRGLLPAGPRLFPVGRLDAETSGLLIATNDGDLAHHLMHPRYGVAKVYRVRLDRPPDENQIHRLRTGVEFEPGVVSGPCEVRVNSERDDRPEIEMTLHEGRYRQVRRMCEAVGLSVKGLHRPAYGPLRLGSLPKGGWRDLTSEEVRRLKSGSARVAPRPVRGRGASRPIRGRPAPRPVPGRVASQPVRRRAASQPPRGGAASPMRGRVAAQPGRGRIAPQPPRGRATPPAPPGRRRGEPPPRWSAGRPSRGRPNGPRAAPGRPPRRDRRARAGQSTGPAGSRSPRSRPRGPVRGAPGRPRPSGKRRPAGRGGRPKY